MRFKSQIPALIILVLSLSATGLTAMSAQRDIIAAGRARFDADVAMLKDTVTDGMGTYAQVLRAGVGFMKASSTVSRDRWRSFVDALELDRIFPGIQGIGFATVVTPSQLNAHIASQRREKGRSTYTIRPPGERDIYTAIIYLEPEDWRNQMAIGYDMFSEPIRRRAMERARDTGEPSLSGKVKLVQENGDDIQAGTLLYLPVYQGPTLTLTTEQRRQSLAGYVYAPFRMRDFVLSALTRRATPDIFNDIRLEIFDGPEPRAENLLFDSRDNPIKLLSDTLPQPLFSLMLDGEISGQRWLFRATSLPSFEQRLEWSRPWTQLVWGGFISLLLTGIGAAVGFGRERSVRAQAILAAEVDERKRAQEQVQVANRELIHRVKNTLAIVTSIATQTARNSTTMAEFNDAFRQRMAALGRVQDLLHPDHASALELENLVRDTLAPYVEKNTTALSISGPHVAMTQEQAVLFGLIINELATNATKYGAWSVPTGHIDVAWRFEHPEGGRRLTLTWQESGGPPVAPPNRKGFGTTVMTFAVERSMNGTFRMTYAEDGVSHLISVPWKEAAVEATAS